MKKRILSLLMMGGMICGSIFMAACQGVIVQNGSSGSSMISTGSDEAGINSSSGESRPTGSDPDSASDSDNRESSQSPTGSAPASSTHSDETIPVSSIPSASSKVPASSVPPTSSNVPANCNHYKLVGNVYYSLLVWTEEENYEIWTCSQCGATGRNEKEPQKSSYELLMESFISGTEAGGLNDTDRAVLPILLQVKASLPANADVFDKICASADWLYENCEYDTENYNNNTIPPESFHYSGVFLTGKAVCAGYTEAFQLFMDAFGIPCETVTGTGNGGPHAWNRVQLDGVWYYVDTTWGADYFMMSYEELSADHVVENNGGNCPQSLPMAYFQRRYQIPDKNLLITPDQLPERIREETLAGKDELIYLVKGDFEADPDQFLPVYTYEEYMHLQGRWGVFYYTVTPRGENTLFRLEAGDE